MIVSGSRNWWGGSVLNQTTVEQQLYDENYRLNQENKMLKRRLKKKESHVKSLQWTIRKLNDRLRKLDPKDLYYNVQKGRKRV